MIIVRIVGGLGNQMFCYAYAKTLEQKGYTVKIDISTYESYTLHGGFQLDKYDMDLPYSTKEENKSYYSNSVLARIMRKIGIRSSNVIKEKNLLFDEILIKVEDNNFISGYFQSEKYFINIRDILLKQFTIKQNISSYTHDIADKIKKRSNSCSIHIRRGDFTNSNNISIHGVCPAEYYLSAIKYLKQKTDIEEYFIFSDDIKWCKENLQVEKATFIENTKQRIPHEDIYLMSLCKNNIIANSTFSWWGAWLNQNNKKIVIAPKQWFADETMENIATDIVPIDWIRL